MGFGERELNNLKDTYKKLYLKSRELETSIQQQDELLEKLIEELFMDRFNKVKTENINVAEDGSEKILKELNVIMAGWKKEFEENTNATCNKNIDEGKAWWRFW